MKSKTPQFGRFAEPSLLILVSLSDGPKHGYAIMQDVEGGTGRPMGAGTLYAALARLEEQASAPDLWDDQARAQQLIDALRPTRPLLVHCGTIWVHGPAARVPVTGDEPPIRRKRTE